MSEITVPGIGPMDKKKIAAVGAVIVLVAGVAYYRHKQNAAAAAAASASDTAAGPAIDPETGFPYGSSEDVAALQQTTATTGGGGGGGGGTVSTGPTGYTDNATWSQAAVAYLTGAPVFLDGPTVSSALGIYIAGENLTAAQADVIHQAIAAVGQPPVSGAGGYPPSLRISATTPPPVQGGGGTGLTPGHVITGPYLVKPNMGLATIAGRFGVSVQHLLQENPGKTGKPGDVLEIQWKIRNGDTWQSLANLYGESVQHLQQVATIS